MTEEITDRWARTIRTLTGMDEDQAATLARELDDDQANFYGDLADEDQRTQLQHLANIVAMNHDLGADRTAAAIVAAGWFNPDHDYTSHAVVGTLESSDGTSEGSSRLALLATLMESPAGMDVLSRYRGFVIEVVIGLGQNIVRVVGAFPDHSFAAVGGLRSSLHLIEDLDLLINHLRADGLHLVDVVEDDSAGPR